MIKRYRAATARRVEERPKPVRRSKRERNNSKIKRGRGRPHGSKDTALLKLQRIQLANEKKRLLPHEFLLEVIAVGLVGGTLGYYLDAKGEKVPNIVTFEQMMVAARNGLAYFAAPIRVEHSGKDGGPIEVFHIPQDRLASLRIEELRHLQAILPKLGGTVKQIEHDPSEGDADAYAKEIGMTSEKKAA